MVRQSDVAYHPPSIRQSGTLQHPCSMYVLTGIVFGGQSPGPGFGGWEWPLQNVEYRSPPKSGRHQLSISRARPRSGGKEVLVGCFVFESPSPPPRRFLPRQPSCLGACGPAGPCIRRIQTYDLLSRPCDAFGWLSAAEAKVGNMLESLGRCAGFL